MAYKHLDSVNMNANNTTGVIQFADKRDNAGKKTGFIVVSWTGAGATKDGTIALKLYYPSNIANTANHQPVTVSTENITTAAGAKLWNIEAEVEKFELVYTKNTINVGTMLQSLYVDP